MSTLTFHKLSFEQLQKDCFQLYQEKLRELDVDLIVSISRGANTISHMFSDLLGTLPISHITMTSYHDLKKLDKPVITEEPNRNFDNKKIVIVDDVSDTGATFSVAMEYFKKQKLAKIYTLAPYIKPHTTFHPDFWLKTIDAWIVFPYDVRETAEGFVKMFASPEQARKKMLEIGFTNWEIETVLPAV